MSGRIPRRGVLVLALGAALATACAPAPRSPMPHRPRPAPVDPRLVARPGADQWPVVFHRAPAPAQTAYRYAVGHERILRYIPCYCGCGADGHRSNWDCYVPGVRGDEVDLDTHGFG